MNAKELLDDLNAKHSNLDNIPVRSLKSNFSLFGGKGAVWANAAHIAENNSSLTLCGTPMLSTNWARIEGVKEIGCAKCIEVYNAKTKNK